jgi:hypothetical protein
MSFVSLYHSNLATPNDAFLDDVQLFFDYGEAFFLGRRANFIEKAETEGQSDGA